MKENSQSFLTCGRWAIVKECIQLYCFHSRSTWMAVLSRLCIFLSFFLSIFKDNWRLCTSLYLGFQDTGTEHSSVMLGLPSPPPPTIYHVWSRTSLQFVDKEAADVAALLMRLKAKVTLVSPERLLRKGADVWKQHIYGEGASDESTSPLNQISCKCFCFLCHFAPPPTPPPLFQNCTPSVELNPRY